MASHWPEDKGGEQEIVKRGGLARRSARRCRGERVGGSNSVVESQPSKLLVAGSIPVSRSILRSRKERASYGRQAAELNWNLLLADLSAEAASAASV